MERRQINGQLIFWQISAEKSTTTTREYIRLKLNLLEDLYYIGFKEEDSLDYVIKHSRFHAHLENVEDEGKEIVLNALHKLNSVSQDSMKKIGINGETVIGFFKRADESDYHRVKDITDIEAKVLHQILFSTKD